MSKIHDDYFKNQIHDDYFKIKIHDDYFKNQTSRVLTRFSFD